HGQVQVGAGVAVGNGVDVEGVDLLARRGQGVEAGVAPAQDDLGVGARLHRLSLPLPCARSGHRWRVPATTDVRSGDVGGSPHGLGRTTSTRYAGAVVCARAVRAYP